ncbi:unnamed protein product, partial [Cyprideis torosa]
MTDAFHKGKISWNGWTGRIDAQKVDTFLKDHPNPYDEAEYFVCGPGEMLDVVEDRLKTKGIDDKKIHTERFTIVKPGDVKRNTGTAGAVIHVELDGEELTLPVATGKTILDALLDAKKEAPYSCMSGSCSTCMAKVTLGRIEMDVCHALDDDEIEEGYILTCQAHPK